jgi:hypothetical protein
MGFREDYSLWNIWQGSMMLLRNQRQWVKHHGTHGRGRSTVTLSQFTLGQPLIVKGRSKRIRNSRVKKALTRCVKLLLKTSVPLLDGLKRRDSGESIIKDDMILWRQLLSMRIEYQKNQRRVLMGEANNDVLMSQLSHLGLFFPS